jgi:hypothetical protein
MKKIKIIIAGIIATIFILGFAGVIICGLIYKFKDTAIGIGIGILFIAAAWSGYTLGMYYEQKKTEKENQRRNNIKEADNIVKNMRKYV